METKLTVVFPAGLPISTQVALEKAPPLELLTRLLKPVFGDSWWGHVPTLRRASMFVDEDGHAKGLPLNPFASEVFGKGIIVGPAVIFSRRVWY